MSFAAGIFHAAGIFVSKRDAPSWRELRAQEELRGFTWFEADHRCPLPPLSELQLACHPIGSSAYEQGGWRYVFLCTEPSDGCCARNDYFSDHYGEDVYCCCAAHLLQR